MPRWLDNLVSSEVKQMVKQAQDDKVSDIEKRIDEAKTPEELDKLEEELKQLEKHAYNSVAEIVLGINIDAVTAPRADA